MDLITRLTDSEKISFTEEFLSRFLAYGFGTLPKREIEILIFHILYHQTDLFSNQSNYEIANTLKISESRIKSFKSESSLKYQQIDHKDALKEIAKLFFESDKSKIDLEGDMIQFALEDPVLKREFEHAVKELGYIVNYNFNREIVKIKAKVFLEIFINNFDQSEEKFKEVIKSQYKDEKKYKNLIDMQYSLNQRIEFFLGDHKNKVDLVMNIISKFFPGIAI